MKELLPSAGLRIINSGPVVVVTCGPPSEPNAITLAWNMVVSRNPALIAISVAPQRYSHGLIIDGGAFVVNVPGRSQLEPVMVCGTRSGRDGDKFAPAGITPQPASAVETVYIAEFPARLECTLFESRPCGDHSLIVGEVKAAFADEAFFGDHWNLEQETGATLHHLGGPHFGVLSEKISYNKI